MISRNGGIVLSASGLLLVLQGGGLLSMGPAFWLAVLTLSGGLLAWAGYSDRNSITWNIPKSAGSYRNYPEFTERADLLKAKVRAEVETQPFRPL